MRVKHRRGFDQGGHWLGAAPAARSVDDDLQTATQGAYLSAPGRSLDQETRQALERTSLTATGTGISIHSLNHPPVILAGKPTTPLGGPRALAVVALLRDMAQRYGTAVIVMMHDEKIILSFPRPYRSGMDRPISSIGGRPFPPSRPRGLE